MADGWWKLAKCRGMDPELFYPNQGESHKVAEAKAVCASCYVRDECLDYAVREGEMLGVWGGLSERERRPLRREWANSEAI